MAKTILVTGATSGFGAAIVDIFAQSDWRVIATGRRESRLQKLVQQYGTQKVYPAAFDIRDPGETEKVIANLPDGYKDIDVLVNNAGLALGTSPADKAKLEDWNTMIATNITGLVTLTHLLLPEIIRRKGNIINLSSIAAHYPYPGGNVYGATKAFVTQFSLGLRSDLQGSGVRVTAIEPGMAETEFTLVRTGGNQAASDALYRGAHPMTAEDIAGTVFWVANLPSHLNVNRIEIMPVSQSWGPFQVYREED